MEGRAVPPCAPCPLSAGGLFDALQYCCYAKIKSRQYILFRMKMVLRDSVDKNGNLDLPRVDSGLLALPFWLEEILIFL